MWRWITIALVCCIMPLVLSRISEPDIIQTQYQVIEKGQYSRIQYITDNTGLTPEFVTGYYYVLRDYNTGEEHKIEISEEDFNSCVVGDTVE